MREPKSSLRLRAEEDGVLRTLYLQFGITSDKLPQHPEALDEFVGTWNNLTGRQDSASEVLHYIFTQRKRGLWVKLGRSPKSKYLPTGTIACRFTREDWDHLDAIYEELQIASDNFALDEKDGDKLTDEFARRTGKIVPVLVLCAAMITRRKGGTLTTLRPKSADSDLAFSDFDEATG